MSIESFKHDKEKRPLIPSTEEAGTEAASPAVQSGPDAARYPKNPIVHRGQDPELFWMEKYGNDDRDDLLKVDIRSLYRHEHIAPESLIKQMYSIRESPQQFALAGMFGNAMEMDELEKVGSYYSHQDEWKNRLIQGDSLLVMTSLLEREGMAGKVQCIYMDPPYGIKYGSNWQMKLNNPKMKDGSDEDLTGEPEQIKAYRDTWELGVHSYLGYLRDRLLVGQQLLRESGSCFVQISEENVHLVRCLMDEVFGSTNFVSQITFQKSGGTSSDVIERMSDFLIWYAKDKPSLKKRQLLEPKEASPNFDRDYAWVDLPDGSYRKLTKQEIADPSLLPKASRRFRLSPCNSQQASKTRTTIHTFKGHEYHPGSDRHWSIDPAHFDKPIVQERLVGVGNSLMYKLYVDEAPGGPYRSVWMDTAMAGLSAEKLYVVQTSPKVIERCLLLSTDPGDLVLDPTCGSGTTAHVAEKWGRRWITIDTSRIALNTAKQLLMRSTYPYFRLHDELSMDIRQGFVYKKVPHVTLGTLANEEEPESKDLYDQPEVDNKKLRVTGPFTVETLQNFDPVLPEALDQIIPEANELEQFEECIFEHLKSAGVKTGIKEECAVFTRVQRLNSAYLHAEGFYQAASGERKAYLHMGPKFGTVSRLAVNEAIKECRARGDADWLLILGFQFESDIRTQSVTTSMGSFMVTKNRMHDDLMQDGLLKKDKKAASFVTIGEPDIHLSREGDTAVVEIRGMDIYDPIKDEVKPRDVADIAYWMVDDDYDGSNFIVRQVFFCGGDKDEFDKWKKGLSNLAMRRAKKDAEKELKIEIDEEAFARVYGHKSHPIEAKPGRKIAVRVISQFGEESTKVLAIE